MIVVGFIVDSQGIAIPLEVSQAVQDAYDVMHADNADMERWIPMLLAAEREGLDPVEFAHHSVKLRQALKGNSA